MSQDVMGLLKKKYQGKKVLVVGLGLQGGGVGIARFFAELGAKVTVTDKKNEIQLASSISALKNYPITFYLSGHKIEDFLEVDLIFKGPSVLWESPEIKAAINKGIPVEMELSFVASLIPAKIIGVTGTRGKSTTTSLIYEVLKQSGFAVYLGGGLPGISTIDYLKTLTEKDYLVMELSSWALSGFHQKKISPNIAVFTNLYPDHLNYYKNLDDYFYDKTAIFTYQKKEGYCVINKNLYDSAKQFFITHISKVKKIAFASSSKLIIFDKNDFPYELTYLKGDHNLENAAAALKVAEILKINKDKAVNIIQQFRGVPFRQQIVGKKNNVIFVNDTTSTTPIATVKAIEAFADKPIYLILGGNAKNLPYVQLINRLDATKKIILLDGSFTQEILSILNEKFKDKLVGTFNDLEKAVNEGFRLASMEKTDCYLLFSPGATSFAMFNNEFHRGEEFNRIVKKII